MGEWLDIASASKSHPVLVFDPAIFWPVMADWDADTGWYPIFPTASAGKLTPTHWMPLPPPPLTDRAPLLPTPSDDG